MELIPQKKPIRELKAGLKVVGMPLRLIASHELNQQIGSELAAITRSR
jgi:hypothetical protein